MLYVGVCLEILFVLFFQSIFFCRAEAIKGMLNKKPGSSAPATSVTQAVQNLSLSSKGDVTSGGSTMDKRPQLTAKELEVLK